MSLTSPLEASLLIGMRAQRQTLLDDFAAWRKRSAPSGELKQHHTQVKRITTQLEAALAAAVAGSAIVADDKPRDLDSLRGIGHPLEVLHFIWDFFRDKLAQRDSDHYRPHLAAADELAWQLYKRFVDVFVPEPGVTFSADQLKEPPLVAYLAEWVPTAQTRHDAYAPQGLESLDAKRFSAILHDLPVPVIGVPWPHAVQVPPLCLVGHEVGHVIAGDLGLLVDAAAHIRALGLPPAREAAWLAWCDECFADTIGVYATGPSFVAQLTARLVGPVGDVRNESPDPAGRYPPKQVRMAFCNAVLVLAGFDAYAAWSDAYGAATGDYAKDAPAVAKALADGAHARLGDRSVATILAWNAAERARIDDTSQQLLANADPPEPFSVRVWIAGAARAQAADHARYQPRDAAVAKDIVAHAAAGVRSDTQASARTRLVAATLTGVDEAFTQPDLDELDREAGRRLVARFGLVPAAPVPPDPADEEPPP